MPARVFNQVAATYDGDWSNLYARSRQLCVEQITRAVERNRALDSALDLAVGTGNFYVELARYLNIDRRYGFDISPGMLEMARTKLGGGVALIHDSALNAEAHVGGASQDLVLCHFLLSFADPAAVLPIARRLLKPGGFLSLATSTQQSLRELHTGRFRLSGKLLGAKRAIKRAFTPTDHACLQRLLEQHGFEVVDATLQRQPVVFQDFADVKSWGFESGWAAGYLDGALGWRLATVRLLFTLAEVVMYPLYPVEANSEISIVLGRARD